MLPNAWDTSDLTCGYFKAKRLVHEFMRAWEYPLLQQQLRNQALGLIPLQQTMTSNGKTVEKSNPGAMGIMMGLGSLARGLGTGGLGWTPFG